MRLGLGREQDIGPDDELREARLHAARRHAPWHELEDGVVQRGPWFIAVEEDLILVPARGLIFERGTATIVPQGELYFDASDGDLTVYERWPGDETWSDHCARQERRQRNRVAS